MRGRLTLIRCHCKPFLAGALLLSLVACSTSTFAKSQASVTVTQIATDYLNLVAAGNSRELMPRIAWSEYSREVPGRTPQAFIADIERLAAAGRAKGAHPLSGFQVSDTDVDGDNADIEFKKPGADKANTISVSLAWSGSGWVIVNDTLFGKDQFVDQVS